jgi:hypothetical protein
MEPDPKNNMSAALGSAEWPSYNCEKCLIWSVYSNRTSNGVHTIGTTVVVKSSLVKEYRIWRRFMIDGEGMDKVILSS